jgi:hypothetical protein
LGATNEGVGESSAYQLLRWFNSVKREMNFGEAFGFMGDGR